LNLDVLSTLNADRADRRAAILVTDIASGEQRLVPETDIAADPLADVLQERLRQGRSGLVEAGGRQVFLTVQVPPVKVIAIGAVHISQALAPMARGLDLDVTIVDPRTAFATPERFPDVPVLAEWPDAALPRLGLDRYTALVALTHDPKIDDPALTAALAADCFYIGALGSRKTHGRRWHAFTLPSGSILAPSRLPRSRSPSSVRSWQRFARTGGALREVRIGAGRGGRRCDCGAQRSGRRGGREEGEPRFRQRRAEAEGRRR
jgi:xanthine dehydrogenase accessory factor